MGRISARERRASARKSERRRMYFSPAVKRWRHCGQSGMVREKSHASTIRKIRNEVTLVYTLFYNIGYLHTT